MLMHEESFDRPTDYGMQHFRRDFGGRLEYEFTERQTRVRHDEHLRFAHIVAVKEQVDIECSRRPALSAYATVPSFNVLQFGEQCQRWNRRFDHGGAIHVIGLIRGAADGWRA